MQQLKSLRRVYQIDGEYRESVMYKDRREEDLRRYLFALLEDENGQLVPYNGRPRPEPIP